MIVAALLLSCVSMIAKPVGLEEARSLGQQFVKSNFELTRQSDNLELVYSMPAFYVFNVGNTGFVILSSDDSYRPLIGYSYEGVFDPDDMAPALEEYLTSINDYRMRKGSVNASLEVTRDWNALRQTGRLVSRHGGREDSYLVQTKWNQNYPYNYHCPVDPAGPGGRAYAGCVATAAAQLMKFWDHPLQGTGSHSYIPETNPQYGTQTANFGATTYDWENMPNSISSSSPMEQIEAVSLLIYHVGVSVDMNYKPSGSGAVTGQLCQTMPGYFFYTNQMQNLYRENYTHEAYMDLVIASLDMGWPMVHRGGGHAYVLDGYDDNDMVHFNWGWSGSSDGWFNIDDHDYTDGESVIYNYVPAAIYSATPAAPTLLTATPDEGNALSVNLSWRNPSFTLTNQTLASIDEIVVMRDNEVIYSEANPTPGATVEFTDQQVPRFDVFKYTVYAIVDGQRGRSVSLNDVSVGPTCAWTFTMSSNFFQGWRGGYVSICNAANHEVGRLTVDNATPANVNFDMPLGPYKAYWHAPSVSGSFTMNLIVKDSQNNTIYTYSGSSTDLEEGLLFEGNNNCGGSSDCGCPTNLTAMQDPEDEQTIILQWTGVEDPGYGYVVFRDSLMYRLINDGSTEFRDVNVPLGGHCYQVATFCEGGWNGETSNMVCEASGGCYAPRNIDAEATSNFKCKLTWEAPENTEGLTGYFLFRKMGDSEYKRIKIFNASTTSFTDNSVHDEGDYYYQLEAFYSALDCMSAPAAYKHNPNQYFLHFYYSPTGTEELAQAVRMYPNPTRDQFVVEAQDLVSVEVCNVLGQRLMTFKGQNDGKLQVNLQGVEPGIYMIRIFTQDGVTTKQIVKQ